MSAITCLEYSVGLTSRNCDCFASGMPTGGYAVETYETGWQYETFGEGDLVGNTFATDYDLPHETQGAEKTRFYIDGVLQLYGRDYLITALQTLTITTPVPGATYQLYYVASVPIVETSESAQYSESGLYVDDLFPTEEVAALAKCDADLWAMMISARRSAVKEVYTQLNAALGKRYKNSIPSFNGYVGEVEFPGYLTTSKQYVATRIHTSGLRSGVIVIRKIALLFSATGTKTFTLVDRNGFVLAPSFTLDTVAGKRVVHSVNLRVPTWAAFEEERDVYLVHEYDAANKPALNRVHCGCRGFSPVFDVTTAQNWPSGYRNAEAWANYIKIGGWTGDDITDFSGAPSTLDPYMYGVAIEAEIVCSIAETICTLAKGYESNNYAMALATAVQRKTAAILAYKKLSSSVPNRNILANREQTEKDAKTWEADFAEIIVWLSNNLPIDVLDCLTCRPRIQTGKLLA
jgi:hypothetical protein